MVYDFFLRKISSDRFCFYIIKFITSRSNSDIDLDSASLCEFHRGSLGKFMSLDIAFGRLTIACEFQIGIQALDAQVWNCSKDHLEGAGRN